MIILQDNGFKKVGNTWIRYETISGVEMPRYFAVSKIRNDNFFVIVKDYKDNQILNTNNTNDIREFISKINRDNKIDKILE